MYQLWYQLWCIRGYIV